mgnify:CR=1 FL=1
MNELNKLNKLNILNKLNKMNKLKFFDSNQLMTYNDEKEGVRGSKPVGSRTGKVSMIGRVGAGRLKHSANYNVLW